MSVPENLSSMSFRIDSPMQLQIAVMNVRASPLLKVFSAIEQALIATVVAELGTNILKYANGKGSLTISQAFNSRGDVGITIVALDRGTGIPDIELALQDSFSSSGTLGLGLPSIKRIMTTLDIQTSSEGTCITTSKFAEKRKNNYVAPTVSSSPRPVLTQEPSISSPIDVEFATCIRPFLGECFSGDFTFTERINDIFFFGVIDVSGHGYQAYQLGRTFVDKLEDMPLREKLNLKFMTEQLHQMAMKTRGAAVGFSTLDIKTGQLKFTGIGNIHLHCYGTHHWSCMPRDGILGGRLGDLQVQSQLVDADCTLVMASDGVSKRGLAVEMTHGLGLPAEQIAQRIVKNAGREADDVSCVVVKCKS